MYDAELALAGCEAERHGAEVLARSGLRRHLLACRHSRQSADCKQCGVHHPRPCQGRHQSECICSAKVAPGVQARPVQCVGTAPTLKVEEFELTSPTASLELSMLESTIEVGQEVWEAALPESEVWKGLEWVDILKKHNDEFNPARIVRSKPGADSSVDELPVCSHGVTCVSQFCCFLI